MMHWVALPVCFVAFCVFMLFIWPKIQIWHAMRQQDFWLKDRDPHNDRSSRVDTDDDVDLGDRW